MFIVLLEYKVPLDSVDKYLESHRLFLNKWYQEKIFIFSGRKIPRIGGVILASGVRREALEAILAQDPFLINKIAEYQIIEFQLTRSCQEFESLLDVE